MRSHIALIKRDAGIFIDFREWSFFVVKPKINLDEQSVEYFTPSPVPFLIESGIEFQLPNIVDQITKGYGNVGLCSEVLADNHRPQDEQRIIKAFDQALKFAREYQKLQAESLQKTQTYGLEAIQKFNQEANGPS